MNTKDKIIKFSLKIVCDVYKVQPEQILNNNLRKEKVIKAKRMSKNGDDIDDIIKYVSESLKNKLAHETTIKLKELYAHLDDDKVQKLNDIFKEN